MLAVFLFLLSFGLASIEDVKCREIPDKCHVAMLAAGVIMLAGGHVGWLNSLLGFLAIGGLFLMLALWRDGMGGGDVKLAATASFVTGLPAAIYAVMFSSTAALLFVGCRAIGDKLCGHKRENLALPFAPFLCIGYSMTFLYIILQG